MEKISKLDGYGIFVVGKKQEEIIDKLNLIIDRINLEDECEKMKLEEEGYPREDLK